MKQIKYITLRIRLTDKELHKLKTNATKLKSNMSRLVKERIIDIIR